ncbi:hypothetical protein HRH25_21905 [Flavisolibacter sp. BT320]|nr:hypothetical protein [Flavisolibacter longurius]
MKLFKILSHPYTLILSFLFIVISGQHLGGFYALYVLLGLMHGAIHSVLAFLGIIVLLVMHHAGWSQNSLRRQVANVTGTALLFASVYFFFSNDRAHYNWGTFEQGFPMFTLMLSAFIAICFLLGTFWKPHPKSSVNQNLLSKV